MDVKVTDVDADNNTISLIYENPKTMTIVLDELRRIGHPVKDVIKTAKGKLYRRVQEHNYTLKKLLEEANINTSLESA